MSAERSGHCTSIEWVTVALEEYKALRQESLAAIDQMQRTLQIGLVAIGVLTAFGGDAVKEGPGVQLGLAISVPVVAALVVALRLDELHRAVDAGAHVAILEQRIARKLNDDGSPRQLDEGALPLTWEARVQENFRPTEDKIRHGVITAVLFAAAAPAVLLGTIQFGKEQGWAWVPVAVAVALVVVLTSLYQRRVLAKVATRHTEACREVKRIRRG